jgi:hypothetical protein
MKRVPMNRVLGTLLTVALLCMAAVPAQADDAEKVMELKRQIIEMQNKGNVSINDFTFCRKVLNYGTFIPWGDPVFPVGGEFVAYFEPLNWFTNMAQGRYEFWMTQDLKLETVAGEVLYEKSKLLDMHFNTAKPVLDVYMTNDFSLGQLPPGEYVFIVVLRDELKGQEFEARKSFTIE